MDIPKVTDFDVSLCEINILRIEIDDCKTFTEIIDISNKLKMVIPTDNSLCKLAFTPTIFLSWLKIIYEKLWLSVWITYLYWILLMIYSII